MGGEAPEIEAGGFVYEATKAWLLECETTPEAVFILAAWLDACSRMDGDSPEIKAGGFIREAAEVWIRKYSSLADIELDVRTSNTIFGRRYSDSKMERIIAAAKIMVSHL